MRPSTEPFPSLDPSVQRSISIISRWVVSLAVVFTAIAAITLDHELAIATAAGGALASVEWLLSAAIARRIALADDRARIGWALLFVMKSTAALGLAALLLVLLSAPGLAFGFGALVAGVVAGAIEAHLRGER